MKTRIITVCIKGKPLSNVTKNKEREKILEEVILNVSNKWKNIDAVVLPGGFFHLDKYIGDLEYEKRVDALSKTSFYKICKKMCKKLSKDFLIIAGVDSECPKKPNIKGEWGDQLCVAWSKDGIEGIGRKVFPVKGEESKHYVCYVDDFNTNKRIVRLRNGKRAVLCACYDMFGCSEDYNNYNKRTTYIKHMFPLDGDLNSSRKECTENFIKLLKTRNIKVGIVSIHRNPRRYWQSHGIATCSAALNGIAIGAAHFSKNLPNMTLTSYKAPNKILKLRDKRKRKTYEYQATEEFTLKNVLVRLFEF